MVYNHSHGLQSQYIECFKLSEIRLAHAYKDQNELEQDLAQSEV